MIIKERFQVLCEVVKVVSNGKVLRQKPSIQLETIWEKESESKQEMSSLFKDACLKYYFEGNSRVEGEGFCQCVTLRHNTYYDKEKISSDVILLRSNFVEMANHMGLDCIRE